MSLMCTVLSLSNIKSFANKFSLAHLLRCRMENNTHTHSDDDDNDDYAFFAPFKN
jgi:hypothetical protein